MSGCGANVTTPTSQAVGSIEAIKPVPEQAARRARCTAKSSSSASALAALRFAISRNEQRLSSLQGKVKNERASAPENASPLPTGKGRQTQSAPPIYQIAARAFISHQKSGSVPISNQDTIRRFATISNPILPTTGIGRFANGKFEPGLEFKGRSTARDGPVPPRVGLHHPKRPLCQRSSQTLVPAFETTFIQPVK